MGGFFFEFRPLLSSLAALPAPLRRLRIDIVQYPLMQKPS